MATSGGEESLRYSGYRTPRRSRQVRESGARSRCHTPNTSPSKLATAAAATAVSAALTRTCKWHGSTRGLENGGRDATVCSEASELAVWHRDRLLDRWLGFERNAR